MAISRAERIPSLILPIRSAQTAGLCSPADHANWTHLRYVIGGPTNSKNPGIVPVSLVEVEIRPNLVQDGALHVEKLAVDVLSVWVHDIDDDPFLMSPLCDGVLPVL